jgi:hypothetical protein
MVREVVGFGVWLAIAPGSGAAQREPGPFLRVEVGQSQIHRESLRGVEVGLRLGTGRLVRFEAGAAYATADSGYAVFDGGAELRPLAAWRVTPVLGVGAGFLVEPSFRGVWLRGTVALEVELAVRTALRLGAHFGSHARDFGPNTWFAGIERRGRGP